MTYHYISVLQDIGDSLPIGVEGRPLSPSFAVSGEIDRRHTMTEGLKFWDKLLPAPGPVHGTVNQDESHLSSLVVDLRGYFGYLSPLPTQ